jgi:hypothetical protein
MENDVVNSLHEIVIIGLLSAIVLVWLITKVLTTWVFWRSMRAFEKISGSVSDLVKNKEKKDIK